MKVYVKLNSFKKRYLIEVFNNNKFQKTKVTKS